MSMSEPGQDRRTRALEILEQLERGAAGNVSASLDAVSPEIVELVLGWAFVDVVDRPGIDLRTREMLTVSALMAMGTAASQLEFHVRAAINVGVTRKEIVEIVLQIAVYAGVPAAMNGIAAVKKAFATLDGA